MESFGLSFSVYFFGGGYRLKKSRKRMFSFLLVFSLLFISQAPVFADNSGVLPEASEIKIWEYPRYSEYIAQNEQMLGSGSIVVPVDQFESSDKTEVVNDYKGHPGAAAITAADSVVTYRFTVANAGLYHINMTYFLPTASEEDVQRSLAIDGKLPFQEAAELAFDRVWVYKNDQYYVTLLNGSQVKNARVEKECWQTKMIKDPTGISTKALAFYFTAGEHTLTFTAISGKMVLGALELIPPSDLMTYAAYKAEQEEKYGTATDDAAESIELQAEDMDERNSSGLFGSADNSSPGAIPFSYSESLVNVLSGSNFNSLDDWVSYNFDIKADGWYRISFKYKQDYRSGGSVYRRIYIDGEVPFEEADAFGFQSCSDWKSLIFGDGETPYLLYLSTGQHVLTLEAVTGEFSDIISRAQALIDDFNSVYRSLFVITGPTPDPYRDYNFDEVAKDELKALSKASAELEKLLKDVMALTDQRGSFMSAPEQLSVNVKNMVEKPDSIANRLNSFVTNLGSFSEWMLGLQSQALDLDLIEILPPEADPTRAGTGFWDNIVYQVRIFIRSFTEQYDEIVTDSEIAPIRVWFGTTGRDQVNIMQEIIEENYDAPVELQLVSGALIPSTLAGIGPDAYMFAAAGEPINYALRGAVAPLNEYDGFDEVMGRFSDGVTVPYTYKEKTYAIPETESYPMLFYRKDILDELDIPIPKTWDDIYNALSKLQSRHMTFGMMTDYTGYLTLLVQNGASIYRDNNTAVNFDNPTGVAAFDQWTDFFVSYKLSTAYSFINRFRTGEMPIGVADFTIANQLRVTAPEISGMWALTPLPGVKQEDGTVDHSAPITTTANIIMKHADHKEEAWRFLKWWSSTENQVNYSEQLEQTMGIVARYAPANIEAFGQLKWNQDDVTAINKQRKWLIGVPEVPGSYIVTRYIGFAFSAVVDSNQDPVKALLDYTEKINLELERKQAEFERRGS